MPGAGGRWALADSKNGRPHGPERCAGLPFVEFAAPETEHCVGVAETAAPWQGSPRVHQGIERAEECRLTHQRVARLLGRSFQHLDGRQQRCSFDKAAEFLFAELAMVTVPFGETSHRFVSDLHPFELSDAQILVTLLPDLTLFQLHDDTIRDGRKLARAITGVGWSRGYSYRGANGCSHGCAFLPSDRRVGTAKRNQAVGTSPR